MILAKGEQHVGTLCVRLSQSQPAVSHHLALLRHGRIIAPRRQDANNFYGLTDAGCALAEVVQSLLDEGTTERPAVRPRTTRRQCNRLHRPAKNRPIRREPPTFDPTFKTALTKSRGAA